MRLINDILDLSKIESGTIEIKPTTFDVVEVFNAEHTSIRNRYTKREVEIVTENSMEHCVVTLDQNRLVQVCANFLTNAIKYTAKGTITMGINYEDGGLKIYGALGLILLGHWLLLYVYLLIVGHISILSSAIYHPPTSI